MKQVDIKSIVIPNKPRSGNYPVGSTVVRGGSSSGGSYPDLSLYLLKAIWERNIEERKDENGNEYLLFKKSIVSEGGVTAYALGDRTPSTIMDGVVVDGSTIVKENGVLKALVGSNFDEESMWTALSSSDSSKQINQSHISNALSGYATEGWVNQKGYATQSSLDSVSQKLNDFLEGSDTDTIINKWKELEAFLSGMTESDNLAEILSTKADITYVDSELTKYVTLATEQTITAIKHFTEGISVGSSKHRIYEQDGVVYLDGDLAVTGGVTAYALGDTDISTIMDGVVVDGNTIAKVDGVLKVLNAGGGEAGSVAWDNITGKPSWIGATKPTYNWSEILAKPTTLSGYGITDVYTKTESENKFVNISGDTMAGKLTITTSTYGEQLEISRSSSGGNSTIKYSNSNGLLGTIGIGGNADRTAPMDIIFTNYNNEAYKVWHAGNDGSGSGLDADMLDGYHSSRVFTQNERLGDYNIDTIDLFGTRDIQPSSEITIEGNKPFNNWGTLLMFKSIQGASRLQMAFTGNTEPYFRYSYGTASSITSGWSRLALLTSNVASATQLQTARTLWGQSFNGTANVSGSLTGVTRIENTSTITISSWGHLYITVGNGSGGIEFNKDSNTLKPMVGNNIGLGAVNDRWTNLYLSNTAYINGKILTNGSIGVGTSSPSGMLDVNGKIYSNDNIIIRDNTWSTSRYLYFAEGGSDAYGAFIAYYGDDRLVLGTRNNSTTDIAAIAIRRGSPDVTIAGSLTAGGNILATGGITCYSSDSRAKTILEELNLSLKDIAESPIVRFKWNNWKIKDDGKTHIGGIAQYVQKILPETILEADGMLNLDYATTAYIYAVQTARHLIKTDTEVDKLKRRIKKLEKQLKKLGYEEVDTLVN